MKMKNQEKNTNKETIKTLDKREFDKCLETKCLYKTELVNEKQKEDCDASRKMTSMHVYTVNKQ